MIYTLYQCINCPNWREVPVELPEWIKRALMHGWSSDWLLCPDCETAAQVARAAEPGEG